MIERVVKDVDPEGKDAALRQMVVVGHSQGGLLTRLTATSSGDRFWRTVSEGAFDDLELTDSARKFVRPVFYFEPSPYVQRLVFVATPHKGSHVAGNWIGKIGASLVSVPSSVVKGAGRLAKAAVGAGGFSLENFSTAVDDMSPGSPFLQALDDTLPSIHVPMHSIVAVDGDGPLEEGDDGVVLYTSAHLPQAVSEVVVPNDHSCQGHARTVAEIRRIVHEHLKACGR
jgi:pimeloyl-ACP methyl ester carboxylesterase